MSCLRHYKNKVIKETAGGFKILWNPITYIWFESQNVIQIRGLILIKNFVLQMGHSFDEIKQVLWWIFLSTLYVNFFPKCKIEFCGFRPLVRLYERI